MGGMEMLKVNTDRSYTSRITNAPSNAPRRTSYKTKSVPIIKNPDEIRHDIGLYRLWEHINNGGAKITNSDRNEKLQSRYSEDKMDYFFIFDQDAGSKENVNPKSSHRLNGETDICGIGRNGRPFIIEVKYKNQVSDAVNQVAKLRFYLSNKHYWPQAKVKHYRKFLNFLIAVQQSGVDAWESQLFYYSIRKKQFIDITNEAPTYNPDWFLKSDHLKDDAQMFIANGEQFKTSIKPQSCSN